MSKNTIVKHLLTCFCILFPSFLTAQKKPLDHSVYDSWKSIANLAVTKDGKYSASIIKEQEGNDLLQIFNLQTGKTYSVPRGYVYQISPDQKFVVAQVKASFADTRQAKIKKVAAEKMPKDSLVIISLDKFTEVRIPNVSDFKLGKDFSDYVAYTLSDTLKTTKGKERGKTLILHNLTTSKEDSIKFVTQFEFSRNGKYFASVIKPNEKDSLTKSQVIYFDLSKLSKKAVSTGKTEYKGLALSEDGTQVAFLATKDNAKKEIKEFTLHYYISGQDSAKQLVDKQSKEMNQGWSVSDNYTPMFSRNGKRLLFGTAPIALEKDTTIPDFEKAQLDIWNWKDPYVQPQQLVELSKEQKRSYLAYINLSNTDSFYQLATLEVPNIQISDENNGKYAIGYSNLPYRIESQWNIIARESMYDIWVYDLENNTKEKIKTKLEASFNFSPNGNYLTWYNTKDYQYYAYNIKTKQELCLTDKLNVIFWNERHDSPYPAPAYGRGPWYENDEAFIVYDKFDAWKLDPTGKKAPLNITAIGRKEDISFRYVNTDPDKRFVTIKDKLLFSAFDNTTKERGYYELNKSMQKLILDKYTFTDLAKALNKDVYVYAKSNFVTSPNLYIASNNWKDETKLTDINPQMKDYNWGTVDLVSWTTFDGETMEGLLYKPENFDPNKKYPMITYFYERMSDYLYQYYPPVPSRSTVNFTYYSSNGYLVFVPDIKYTVGHPGKSAYNCIVSGVQELSKNSWVDKDNIGIQGQSWGGYQTAYLITCTNIFKAAGAGAPVSNMFSAYNGIRWSTGLSRQYQYEQTQSRIGKTIWEAPELYKENSPIFFADKVNTPLLIMHNDQDGAVPWYQGIELFMGLRRLGKPVWMLQYNGENHNLLQRKNSKDLSIRLQQFFDHYLKGAPMPVWMKDGVPATKKGYTYGFELE